MQATCAGQACCVASTAGTRAGRKVHHKGTLVHHGTLASLQQIEQIKCSTYAYKINHHMAVELPSCPSGISGIILCQSCTMHAMAQLFQTAQGPLHTSTCWSCCRCVVLSTAAAAVMAHDHDWILVTAALQLWLMYCDVELGGLQWQWRPGS